MSKNSYVFTIDQLESKTLDWDWWPENLLLVGYPEYLIQYIQGGCDLDMLKKKVQLWDINGGSVCVEWLVVQYRDQLEGSLF